MPNNTEHNKDCEKKGIASEVCKIVNAWMDDPSSQMPGCSHRNFRHGSRDCNEITRIVYDYYAQEDPVLAIAKSKEARKACTLHRELDKQNELCGCRALFE
jgi:hypothetical protein